MLNSSAMHAIPVPLQISTSDAVLLWPLVLFVSSMQRKSHCGSIMCTVCPLQPPICSLYLQLLGMMLPSTKGAYTRISGPHGWECTIVHDGGVSFLQNVLPRAKNNFGMRTASTASVSHDCKKRIVWQSRLGHPGDRKMTRLECKGMVTSLDTAMNPCSECPGPCFACIV